MAIRESYVLTVITSEYKVASLFNNSEQVEQKLREYLWMATNHGAIEVDSPDGESVFMPIRGLELKAKFEFTLGESLE